MCQIIAYCDGMEYTVMEYDNTADMIRDYRANYVLGCMLLGAMRPCRMVIAR